MLYLMIPDINNSPEIFLDTEYSAFWTSYDRLPKADNSDAPPQSLSFSHDDKGFNKLSDFLLSSPDTPLISTKFKELLESLEIGELQFIESTVYNEIEKTAEVYYATQVLANKKCLDLSNSKYRKDDPNSIMIDTVYSFQFDSDLVQYKPFYDLFRATEYSLFLVASNKLKRACEQAEITGIKFVKPEDWDGWLT